MIITGACLAAGGGGGRACAKFPSFTGAAPAFAAFFFDFFLCFFSPVDFLSPDFFLRVFFFFFTPSALAAVSPPPRARSDSERESSAVATGSVSECDNSDALSAPFGEESGGTRSPWPADAEGVSFESCSEESSATLLASLDLGLRVGGGTNSGGCARVSTSLSGDDEETDGDFGGFPPALGVDNRAAAGRGGGMCGKPAPPGDTDGGSSRSLSGRSVSSRSEDTDVVFASIGGVGGTGSEGTGTVTAAGAGSGVPDAAAGGAGGGGSIESLIGLALLVETSDMELQFVSSRAMSASSKAAGPCSASVSETLSASASVSRPFLRVVLRAMMCGSVRDLRGLGTPSELCGVLSVPARDSLFFDLDFFGLDFERGFAAVAPTERDLRRGTGASSSRASSGRAESPLELLGGER